MVHSMDPWVQAGRAISTLSPLLYFSGIVGPSPTTRAVSGPKSLVLGGACTDANPRVILLGRRVYIKQDYPRIGLVGVCADGSAHQSPLVA